MVECSKLAYADREKFYGDPDFVEVPFPTLLSDAYNAERRKLVTDKASMELRPGSVEGFGAIVKMKPGAKLVAGMGAGEPTVGRMGEVVGDTVHFDIVDQAGNMVTATPSGGWLQSSPVIPELGFCLGTRGQMFWLEEGHPASLAPGKRPRTTLSPTLALRDGDAYLAWGSPGGDQQDQWITQFFLRHVHAGMNLQEAIDAPAWHSEHFPISFWPRTARPGVLQIEKRVPKETRDELTRRGHIVEVEPEWSEGRLTAASKDGKRRRAAANPRGMQGYAAGRCQSFESECERERRPVPSSSPTTRRSCSSTARWSRSGNCRSRCKRDEIMCIVGPSGCGKTTFLRCIAGLTEINTGQLLVHGKPVAGPPDGVAMVFQHFGLLPWKTVYENAAFGLAMAGKPAAEIKERVTHYLDLVGLAGFEKHYPYQLSGGMQQRVGLVRALAMNPSVLLMDEPFAALDAQTREILQEELLQLMERPEERKTMVFITHSIDEAILLGDRIAVMSARPGRIKEVLDVPFGHPRDGNALRTDPRFGEMRAHIWGELHTARPQLTRTPREVA